MKKILVSVFLLIVGCGDLELDPSRAAGAAGSVAVSQQSLTVFDKKFTNLNSWFNSSNSMFVTNRMTACLRAYVRTMPLARDWDCFYTDRATCTNRDSVPTYLYDCRPNGGNVERCEVGIGIATAGYCLWNVTSNGNWSSQHYLQGGKTLLASEPGYTNRWFVR